MNARVIEVAPELFQISLFVPEADLRFNQFLARDDEPLLFHTGMRAIFPIVHEAVASLIDPRRLRWIGFSHFEADECGSLNQWLAAAPEATAVCSLVGALVSVNDFADRPARPLAHDEVLATGRQRFRFRATPHVPHCWEAGVLFEETNGTLLCSDLLHQGGDVEAVTSTDVLDRVRRTLVEYQAGPLANYLPWTASTMGILGELADLQPRALATMHGATYRGDGARALRGLADVMRDVLAPAP